MYFHSLIILLRIAFILSYTLTAGIGYSEVFELPSKPRDSVIGDQRSTTVRVGETLLDIARANDLGHDQIIAANPKLDRWIPPPGEEVLLPSMYIIPSGPRRGIVLNLAELRLYFYARDSRRVYSFPVSVGNIDWQTPTGSTQITAKQREPAWYPPASIRREHAEEGDDLPAMVPPGDPRNPLGHYALRLGRSGYLIHGTDESRQFGIGMRVSHGCIRLYPEDIEQLFGLVSVGTSVRIVYEPIKVGWLNGTLYLEVHNPVKDPHDDPWPFEYPRMDDVIQRVRRALPLAKWIDYDQILAIYNRGDGIPRALTTESVDAWE